MTVATVAIGISVAASTHGLTLTQPCLREVPHAPWMLPMRGR
jgi:hypothetical protein